MKRKSLMSRVNAFKKKTGWSWERIAREIHRVNECEGITHTTLFRVATKKNSKPQPLTEKYITEGLDKLEEEAS